jgi:activator of 2-hydroxyglutaryl-CoA dehydratase
MKKSKAEGRKFLRSHIRSCETIINSISNSSFSGYGRNQLKKKLSDFEYEVDEHLT